MDSKVELVKNYKGWCIHYYGDSPKAFAVVAQKALYTLILSNYWVKGTIPNFYEIELMTSDHELVLECAIAVEEAWAAYLSDNTLI